MATSLTKSGERSGSLCGSGSLSASRFKSTVNPRLVRFCEGGDLPTGSVWEVRIIEAGESLNGPIYTPSALKAAVTVFEGSPVYLYKWGEADPLAGAMPHLKDEVQSADGRGLVGNLVGSLEGVFWNEEAQALDGYLKVYDSTLREKMVAAYQIGDIGVGGNRDVFGLSIDAQGDKSADGKTVERITSANSVDVVTTPAAGGRIRRLVAALQNEVAPVVAEPKQPENASVQAEAQPKIKEATVPKNVKLKEMAAAEIAQQLKGYADQLSAASDEEAPAVLQSVWAMLEDYMGMEMAVGTGMEEATGKHAAAGEAMNGQPTSVGSYTKNYQGALSDDFARMTAGLAEALKSGDPVKLREAVVEAVGEEPQLDEKDKTIAGLKERLKGQAITAAMVKLTEDLAEGAAPTVLKLIDHSALSFSDDFSEVSGLKEAIKEVVKSFPGFAKVAASVVAPVADAPLVETVAAPAVPALGQDVPLRESVEQGAGSTNMTMVQAKRRLGNLKKRMLRGDTKAAVEHRRLRSALNGRG